MKLFKYALAFLLTVLLTFSAQAKVGETVDFSSTPATHNGAKWRLAYYEGGEYIDYQSIFVETVRGMMKLGWIEAIEIPAQKDEQTRELWAWLRHNKKWWLAPLLIVLLVVGVLVVVGSTVLGPFLYPLF